MSQWTHVCGCIRFDALRLENSNDITLEDIKKRMGATTIAYDSNKTDYVKAWDACEKDGVPCGSEGSIQFFYYEEPNKSSIPSFVVGIYGDLRDYGMEDVVKIEKWFTKVCIVGDCMSMPYVRSAVLLIEVEFKPPIHLRFEDGEDIGDEHIEKLVEEV